LPPCGGGAGRGVATRTAFSAYPSPQPSPTRGEGADRAAWRPFLPSRGRRSRWVREARLSHLRCVGQVRLSHSLPPCGGGAATGTAFSAYPSPQPTRGEGADRAAWRHLKPTERASHAEPDRQAADVCDSLADRRGDRDLSPDPRAAG